MVLLGSSTDLKYANMVVYNSFDVFPVIFNDFGIFRFFHTRATPLDTFQIIFEGVPICHTSGGLF